MVQGLVGFADLQQMAGGTLMQFADQVWLFDGQTVAEKVEQQGVIPEPAGATVQGLQEQLTGGQAFEQGRAVGALKHPAAKLGIEFVENGTPQEKLPHR